MEIRTDIWDADVVNSCLVVACVIAGIACIPRIKALAPTLWGSLLRWRESLRLYNSIRLSRDRNILAAVCILPLCLIAARFCLVPLSFPEEFPIWGESLVITGILLAFLLVRKIMSALFGFLVRSDVEKLCFINFFNFLTVLTAFLAVCAGIMGLAGVEKTTARTVLWIESGMLYSLYLIRNWQILSSKGRTFKAFLYLCALEFVPLFLTAAGAIIF